MFNIGGAEVLVIALIALVVVGPEQLPSVLRKVGKYASQFRSMSNGLRQEFMAGMDQMDPTKWDRGSGKPDEPILPKGYADRVAAEDPDNPFQPKPVSAKMADPTPQEAAAEASAKADKASAAAKDLQAARKDAEADSLPDETTEPLSDEVSSDSDETE